MTETPRTTTPADAITFENLMAHREVAVPACEDCGAVCYGLHSWDCPTAIALRDPVLTREAPKPRRRWWQR